MNRPPQFAASFISNRQCRPLALLGRADRPPSCPLSGVYLPSRPAVGEAVDDPLEAILNPFGCANLTGQMPCHEPTRGRR